MQVVLNNGHKLAVLVVVIVTSFVM